MSSYELGQELEDAADLDKPDEQLSVHEENAGQTNSSTVRLEANGVFVVQRVGAIAEAVVGS